ncbi:MAG: hypothetical protein JZU65_23030, partial [Chlorobium sp.]|nr:hypothetical protein [Chlorobium sp.]
MLLDENNDEIQKVEYEQNVFGTWGRFKTPSGSVEFLETKARIGTISKDREKRLTRFLRPVREVLPTQIMDFNQLLQRDLDDHRVASGLVPYVLNASKIGPAFFPPIVAAFLPFEGSEPRKHFPAKIEIDLFKDDIAYWKGYRFGSSFQYDRMYDNKENEDHRIRVGRISWNPEDAKLVVLDGQHRAMALLAIDRTINGTWSESGEKYKYFYEPIINEILRGKTAEEKRELFDNIEFPVTVAWFPESNEEGKDHHATARKLFVDVNQNARTPSESRILLLSDNELLSIFTRHILNEFRHKDNTLPIFAIEYDHPGRDQASSSKWSAISNVIILRDCVNRSIFGPSKYITNFDVSFGGRESEFDRSVFMRQALCLEEEIGETIEDMRRDDISNTQFPLTKLDFMKSQLMKGWGAFIVKMLSDLLPYKVHGDALNKLKSGWATAGSTDSLAKDAIFEGVGMYWTIRDSYQHWERLNQLRNDLKQKPLDKTDIVLTWNAIDLKKTQFYSLRSKEYLSKDDPKHVEISNCVFDVFSTNACQLGYLLTARTIAYKFAIPLDKMDNFIKLLIEATNAALVGGPAALSGRRTVFWKGHEEALNRIQKLDTPFAMH